MLKALQIGLLGAMTIMPLSTTALATEQQVEGGTLNPEEMNVHSYARRIETLKKTDGYFCWFGYEAHKAGIHDVAEKILGKCAENGNHASMILYSHIHENGYGVKKSPAKATEWVKRAADEGYSIGQFNYGIALIKGHGTKRDMDAGKDMIGKAAKQGDKTAVEFMESGYDLDIVTPDAEQPEKWKLF